MERVKKIVVMAKQVPDTRNVGKDAMTPEGTVNRAALAAIFNPEDLNALEMALQIKERVAGSEVYVLTMGPQRASDVIREAMFRGADGGYLLSGKEFAGSDTLATSYALSLALRKIQPDIVVAGLKGIAQVGAVAHQAGQFHGGQSFAHDAVIGAFRQRMQHVDDQQRKQETEELFHQDHPFSTMRRRFT